MSLVVFLGRCLKFRKEAKEIIQERSRMKDSEFNKSRYITSLEPDPKFSFSVGIHPQCRASQTWADDPMYITQTLLAVKMTESRFEQLLVYYSEV